MILSTEHVSDKISRWWWTIDDAIFPSNRIILRAEKALRVMWEQFNPFTNQRTHVRHTWAIHPNSDLTTMKFIHQTNTRTHATNKQCIKCTNSKQSQQLTNNKHTHETHDEFITWMYSHQCNNFNEQTDEQKTKQSSTWVYCRTVTSAQSTNTLINHVGKSVFERIRKQPNRLATQQTYMRGTWAM